MADQTTSDDADFTDDLTADGYDEPAGPSLLARMGAELAGTFILVAIGAGTAMFGAQFGNGSLTIGLAFGLAVMIVAVALGPTSGAHLNPAVTVAIWLAGRFPGRDVAPYILSQVIGGAVAGGVLFWFAESESLFGTTGRQALSDASIGFGDHSPAGFGIGVGLAAEVIATGLLALIVLGATTKRALASVAPFAIGFGLAVLVVWTIPFTNGALNPARATGTALFADTWALQQLWAWWLAPVVGAAIVGLLYRVYGPAEDIMVREALADED